MKIQRNRLIKDILKNIYGEKSSGYAKRCLESIGFYFLGYQKNFQWDTFAGDYWFNQDIETNNWRFVSDSKTTTSEWRVLHAKNFMFLVGIKNEINRILKIKVYRVKYNKSSKWYNKNLIDRHTTLIRSRTPEEAVKIVKGQGYFADKISSIKEIKDNVDYIVSTDRVKWPELVNEIKSNT